MLTTVGLSAIDSDEDERKLKKLKKNLAKIEALKKKKENGVKLEQNQVSDDEGAYRGDENPMNLILAKKSQNPLERNV